MITCDSDMVLQRNAWSNLKWLDGNCQRSTFSCRHFGIHQEAPEFVEMSVEQEILETGIKVVDLLAPYAKGGKIGKVREMSVFCSSAQIPMKTT